MTEFRTRIPLRPIPKQRPRLGRGGTRTPERTRRFEKMCSEFLRHAWRIYWRERDGINALIITLDGAVELRAVFIMPRPQRMTHRANGGTLAASKPAIVNTNAH